MKTKQRETKTNTESLQEAQKTKSKQMGKRPLGQKLPKSSKMKQSPQNPVGFVCCLSDALSHSGWLAPTIALFSGNAQKGSQPRRLDGSYRPGKDKPGQGGPCRVGVLAALLLSLFWALVPLVVNTLAFCPLSGPELFHPNQFLSPSFSLMPENVCLGSDTFWLLEMAWYPRHPRLLKMLRGCQKAGLGNSAIPLWLGKASLFKPADISTEPVCSLLLSCLPFRTRTQLSWGFSEDFTIIPM